MNGTVKRGRGKNPKNVDIICELPLSSLLKCLGQKASSHVAPERAGGEKVTHKPFFLTQVCCLRRRTALPRSMRRSSLRCRSGAACGWRRACGRRAGGRTWFGRRAPGTPATTAGSRCLPAPPTCSAPCFVRFGVHVNA